MMTMMLGPVRLGLPQDAIVSTTDTSGLTPSAWLTVMRDGTILVENFNGTPGNVNAPSAWASSPYDSIGDGFWMRATLNSGVLATGITDTWVRLNANRAFQNIRSTFGVTTANITIEIAGDAAGANVLTSFRFDLTARRTIA